MECRKALLLAMVIGWFASLASCGFTPVYGPEAQIGQELSDIQVAPPTNREGYLFVSNIEERIGRNPNAGNLLAHDIIVFEEGVNELGATRSQVVGKINYRLISEDNGEVIATGSVETFAGYTPTSQGFGSTQRDATERLMQMLADRTITDLIIKLSPQ